MVYEFDVEFDRYASEMKKTLNLVDKLATINTAQEILFQNWTKLAEVDQYIKDRLSPFEKKDITLPVTDHTADVSVAISPPDCYRMLRRRLKAAKEQCGTKTIPLTPFRVNEISLGLKSLWRPSFEWEQGFYDEGEKGIYIYHNQEYKPLELIVDYYRYPAEIHAPSMEQTQGYYIDWNGEKQTKDTVYEMTGFSHIPLIEISVLLARARFGDAPDFNIHLQRIINKSNII